jgi:murein DD-endopeptidase MepM/ murein hydrolase activator NlpD
MLRSKLLLWMSTLLLAACQTAQAATVISTETATLPPVVKVAERIVATPVPTINPATNTPKPSPTATYRLILTNTAAPSETPTVTLTPSITNTLRPIASATLTDSANDPNNTPVPTWTAPPPDPARQVADHYRLRRPIADSGVNYVDRTYPYGGTSGGQFQVHKGVEFINPRGTPILAAADGTVFFAGDDVATVFGASASYYGNLVVIQHNFTSPEGQPVYTLYGHMDRLEVQTGQVVQAGLQIGSVGDSGIAMGPHLHFEVRVGDPYSFAATRNPELWIYPYQTFGTLMGVVTDANGTVLRDVTIQVKSTDITRYAFSYADDTVNSDPAFGENFTLGDLPANYYEVSVNDNGRVRFQQLVYVYPSRTTWVEVKLK